jgi:AcrR family transcriptional regulator
MAPQPTVLGHEGSPPPGLRERARLERFARIRAAAEQLFREKSFDQITTREVARLAGVGEATLFRYVSSKHELLLLVIGEKMDRLIEHMEAADAAPASAAPTLRDGYYYLQRIRAVYSARVDFYLSDPENVTSYLQYGFMAGSRLGAQSVMQGDRVIGLVTSILMEGQTAGVLAKSVAAPAVAQNCHGIYIHEVLRTPVRGFASESLWDRCCARLDAQLLPLVMS